jgi:hypothetical protein
MTKWDKLNKELNDALDTMTSEDWNTWASKFKQKQNIENQMEQTVEEKALWLIAQFRLNVINDCESAKKCALIAVEEILEVLYSLKLGNALDQELEYYEQLKNELNISKSELWATAKKVSEHRPKLK